MSHLLCFFQMFFCKTTTQRHFWHKWRKKKQELRQTRAQLIQSACRSLKKHTWWRWRCYIICKSTHPILGKKGAGPHPGTHRSPRRPLFALHVPVKNRWLLMSETRSGLTFHHRRRSETFEKEKSNQRAFCHMHWSLVGSVHGPWRDLQDLKASDVLQGWSSPRWMFLHCSRHHVFSNMSRAFFVGQETQPLSQINPVLVFPSFQGPSEGFWAGPEPAWRTFAAEHDRFMKRLWTWI